MTASWTLALRLARRELRAGLSGFRIFAACLGLGVAAIAAVGTMSTAIDQGLQRDARKLLGGDIGLRLQQRAASPEQLAWLRAHATALSSIITLRAMAAPLKPGAGQTLVEVKAVDGRYPLVGRVRLASGRALAEVLGNPGDGLAGVAERGLLDRLKLKVGDRLALGDAHIVIADIIEAEPDRISSVFSLGPRLMITAQGLAASGLVLPGSRVSHHYRLLVDGAAGAWLERLKKAFPSAGWRMRTAAEAAPGFKRFIDRLGLFLSFVGLAALLVGGIGVGNAVSAYLERKTATIAIWKSLGASSGLVFRAYLLQITALGLIAVAAGVVAGGGAMEAALALTGDLLPVPPQPGPHPGPLLIAIAFGMVTALTFALMPLARTRGVPAAALFRNLVAPAGGAVRRRDLLAVGLGVVLLALLTVATAAEPGFAYWFVGGTLLAFTLMRGAAWGLAAAARRAGQPAMPMLRLALANLYRPGAATPSMVMSVGLGLAVLVAVTLIQANLAGEIRERLPDEAPAFFFIDIQPHQAAAFDAAVSGIVGAHDPQRVPTLRGRIVAINGVAVEKARYSVDSAWAIRGDRALTYAAEPLAGTDMVAGEWWPPEYRGAPLISLDAGLARGFGVGVGDSLSVNVLGRDITARIANLRRIDWQTLRFDFAIIFAPGTLEGAPHTHIAAIKVPPASEAAIEAAMAEHFKNVSVVRVRDALASAARILEGVGAAVTGTAALTVVAGALVLAGAVAAGRRRRIYDAVIYKVLGWTRWRIIGAFLLEFGVIGLATGIVAGAIGSLVAFGVIRYLMHANWTWYPGLAAATVAGCLLVTVALGFAGTWRVLGEKAAPHLRNR